MPAVRTADAVPSADAVASGLCGRELYTVLSGKSSAVCGRGRGENRQDPALRLRQQPLCLPAGYGGSPERDGQKLRPEYFGRSGYNHHKHALHAPGRRERALPRSLFPHRRALCLHGGGSLLQHHRARRQRCLVSELYGAEYGRATGLLSEPDGSGHAA